MVSIYMEDRRLSVHLDESKDLASYTRGNFFMRTAFSEFRESRYGLQLCNKDKALILVWV
jgi:hypothetical protein